MFKSKEVNVALIDEAKETYLELKTLVEIEKKSGKTRTVNQQLFASINEAIIALKDNPQQGIHIMKRQIPAYYQKRYQVTNLWKYNLIHYWRLIYWIKGTEINIINFVLEIMDHKKYNKRFGYKKR